MADQREYDVIVIGGGPTGENVAARAVQGGLSAVVVESELVGGECSYWACMPSKALLRPGQAVAEARRVAGAREAVTGHIDAAAVLGRRDGFAHNWDDEGQVEWLDGAGVAFVRGHGRLAGERRMQVDTGSGVVDIGARHAIVLATGSRPTLPPVPGLSDAKPWTTRDATSAKAVPERLLVIGGGVAGCELAQAWAWLGSTVSLFEVADRLLASMEPFAGELVAESMREDGIDVRAGVSISEVSRAGDGHVSLSVDGSETIEGDEILVAAGRRPNTEDIGLETIGVEPGSKLVVDDSMLVAGVDGEWLYATGDANGRALLTHQGKYQGRVCGDAIAARARGDFDGSRWSKHSASADHCAVPGMVFTDPEVASVGLTETKAREAGHRVRAVDFELSDIAGASLFADDYKGKARIVVDEDRRVIAGATFVGAGVAELLHSATVAIVGEITIDRLWHAVPSYPTISEIWLRLLEEYGL